MNRAYECIDSLIEYINKNTSIFSTTAVRAYRRYQIDLPIVDCTATFCCEKYEYEQAIGEDDTYAPTLEKLTVNMICYVSFNNSALSVQQISGDILEGIKNNFSGITGYSLGKIETDEDVRAFKVESMIYFDLLTAT